MMFFHLSLLCWTHAVSDIITLQLVTIGFVLYGCFLKEKDLSYSKIIISVLLFLNITSNVKVQKPLILYNNSISVYIKVSWVLKRSENNYDALLVSSWYLIWLVIHGSHVVLQCSLEFAITVFVCISDSLMFPRLLEMHVNIKDCCVSFGSKQENTRQTSKRYWSERKLHFFHMLLLLLPSLFLWILLLCLTFLFVMISRVEETPENKSLTKPDAVSFVTNLMWLLDSGTDSIQSIHPARHSSKRSTLKVAGCSSL
jgi:hypothetical protein